jgi:dolichol-phosphate mannosyltransferase
MTNVMVRKLNSLDILTSALDEEESLPILYKRICLILDTKPELDWKLHIVDNGSSDSTWESIKTLSRSDKRVVGYRMSRTFPFDSAITATLDKANSDAVVIMCSDLQDPPELITDFILKWEEGYENIYMVVTERTGTGPIRTFNSKAFYWLAGKLTDGRIPRNASDYRLVDRKVYEAVRSMEERNRFVRGLFAWVGFNSIGIEAVRAERFGGVSNAHSLKVIDLAFKGIFSHSYIPLKIITLTGVALSGTSFFAFVAFAITWFYDGVPFAGFGTLVSLALLAFGILTFMLGLIAEYVGLIYEEVKQRPNFVVAKTIGDFVR